MGVHEDSSTISGAALIDNAHLLGQLDLDSLAYSGAQSNGHAFEFRESDESALQQAASTVDTAAQPILTEEDDYDDIKVDPSTVLLGGKGGGLQTEATLESPRRSRLGLSTLFDVDLSTATNTKILPSKTDLTPSNRSRRKSIPVTLQTTDVRGRYLLSADDPEIREILSRGLQREAEGPGTKLRSRFSDLVFTRQFTTFDRQNPASASSPFHGFFTLFWLSIFLMLVKLAASNWKTYGSVFGPHEILTMMFHRDVIVLGLTDGLMCASTVFCLLLQKVILAGYLSWDRSGWIIQNVGKGMCSIILALRPAIVLFAYKSPIHNELSNSNHLWQTMMLSMLLETRLYNSQNTSALQTKIAFLDLADTLPWRSNRLDNTSKLAMDPYGLHCDSLYSYAYEAA